jgi:hypothetical protein
VRLYAPQRRARVREPFSGWRFRVCSGTKMDRPVVVCERAAQCGVCRTVQVHECPAARMALHYTVWVRRAAEKKKGGGSRRLWHDTTTAGATTFEASCRQRSDKRSRIN